MKIEYILWGLPKGSNDVLDEKVLKTGLDNPRAAETIKKIASRDGWHSFRIQKLDLDEAPDFSNPNLINKRRKR